MRAIGRRFGACSARVLVVAVVLAMAGSGTSAQTLLSAPWTAVGPAQVASQSYGNVSGRVTALAIDPADASGNTVYVGTTGGGVWKSVNAAGPVGSVVFKPLTDTLGVFSANAGSPTVPSLSIGALSVANGVVLAGTGDPNDALDSYYGEGILRSADGGATWTLAQQSNDDAYSAGHHTFRGLATAGFAWSTATPNLVVAAMSQSAEGVLVNAADATYSVMGLYYSIDAGVTWQMAFIQDGLQVVQMPGIGGAPGNAATSVVWNAARQKFYAAVRFHGYYESDNGVIWTRSTAQPGTGMTLAACPTNPGSVGSPGCPMFRGALAVQAATGDTFAISVDANNLDQGVWQDVCGLVSGSCAAPKIAYGKRLGSAALEVGSGSTAIAQGDYNLALAAVATGSGASADTLLFAGTVDVYRCSIAAGCGWRNTTNAVNGCAARAQVAPDEHAIAGWAGAGTGGLPLVYFGNDGGLWRSTDGVNQLQAACATDDATHFQNLNAGLGSLAQVVSLAQHPTDPATLLVGLGANGTAGTGAASTAGAWPQLAAGEGGMVAIDQANPANWYVSVGAGVALRYCGKGNGCAAADFTGAATIGAAQVGGDASLIYAPFLLDPALTTDVLVGTCKVWRGAAQSGAGWPGTNAISTELGGAVTGVCAGSNAMVRSLAAAGPASGAASAQDAGSTVLYAGMAGRLDGGAGYAGHVFANMAAGTAGSGTVWTDVATSTVTNDTGRFNAGGFDVSAVVADAHDATGKTVYATVMGFAGNGVNAPHVYRSVNGGGSWTNISGNLPNVPANALLVDPNDANTIYVATDAGMYVTTTVTNCSLANCWSGYGTGLPNSPVTGLAAAVGMATGDGRQGELRAATYGRGVWQIPLLTATGVATSAMTLAPTSLTFAAQAVGQASAAQTILVTNSGNAPLAVARIAMTGDFTETDNCAVVTVGGTCSVQVSFLPTATGARTGLVTIYGNVAGGQATAALSGTALPPAAVVLNPIMVTYSVTNVGASSTAQNITISNTGGVTATLTSIAVIGDFTISANTCGGSLASQVGCTVAVKFVPTASGTRNGMLTVIDSAGTQTASLTGTGVLPATDALAPLALTFGAQVLNTTGATQQVTLSNSGDAALVGIAAQITSGDFTVVNSCGNSLSGHSSCALVVGFVPTAVGARTGVLTVTDTYRAQTVTLNGTGLAPAGVSLSPVSGMAFAAAAVGATTAAQTVTLTNNGGVALAVQGIAVTGDFAILTGGNMCGATLAAGAACTVQVVFAPTAAGARVGSLVVTDSAVGSPHSLVLTGTGVDFALAPNGPTTASIAAGGQAVYPLLLSSAAGVPGTVTFACTGAPAYATCVVTPATASLGSTTTISVTVATNIARLEMPELGRGGPVVWVVGLLPLGLIGRRRLWRLAAIGCLMILAGCGVSREIPAATPGGGGGGGGGTTVMTPSGTYNLVITGTSTGLVRSVGLTLVVK